MAASRSTVFLIILGVFETQYELLDLCTCVGSEIGVKNIPNRNRGVKIHHLGEERCGHGG